MFLFNVGSVLDDFHVEQVTEQTKNREQPKSSTRTSKTQNINGVLCYCRTVVFWTKKWLNSVFLVNNNVGNF